MAPINSQQQQAATAPAPKINPADPATLPQGAGHISLFGYQPDQRLLDHAFGRYAQEPDALQPPNCNR